MELQTKRTYIRSLRETDWPALQKIWLNLEASPYAAYDAPLPTDADGSKALTKQFADSGLFFAVCLSDQIIGYVGFHMADGRYNLGYCFSSAYHGKGYAYESVKALIGHLMREDPKAEFTAGTALANTPSCSLLKKLGFICLSTETVSFDGRAPFQGGNFILKPQ